MDLYEQKYNAALETVQEILSSGADAIIIKTLRLRLQSVFPKLKESEDERIQKSLIKAFGTIGKKDWGGLIVRDILAWLEKQGDYDRLIEEMKKRKELLSKEKEKATSTNDKLSLGGRIAMLQELLAFNICNTTDNDEPKFKVGNWIVDDEIPNDVFCVIEVLGEIYKVIDIDGDDYHIPHYKVDKQFHLWTIADASAGDVLAINWHENDDSWEKIIIFKKYHNKGVEGLFNAPRVEGYGNTFRNGKLAFQWEKVPYYSKTWTDNLHPATKEQRDLLFQKMKEAGYEWDADKEELKKVEPKTLDADKVIEWLDEHVPTKFEDMQNYVNQFKKDFGLC